MKPKWITGKALQTVIALNEVQAGDWVKLKPCSKVCAARARACTFQHHGQVTNQLFKGYTQTKIEEVDYGDLKRRTYFEPNLNTPILLSRRKDQMGTFFTYRNIRAWKPGDRR